MAGAAIIIAIIISLAYIYAPVIRAGIYSENCTVYGCNRMADYLNMHNR